MHFAVSYSVTRTHFNSSVMYGANDIGTRRSLWNVLANMQSPQPWIIAGDFNCIRRNSEKLDSSAMNATAMSEFNDFVDDAILLEMPTTGSTYTWCNMIMSRPILCRLDCTLISSNCLLSFPHYATHIALGI